MRFSALSVCMLSLVLDVLAVPSPTAELGALQPSGNQQHVSLSRRSMKRRTEEELGKALRRRKMAIEAKYGIGHAKGKKRAIGMNLLTNVDWDTCYFGSLAIGTPAVSFDVILDTGSSDLWVAATTSSDLVSDIPTGSATFNAAASSTFQSLNQSFDITYASGSAVGELGQDKVQMAGFEVTAQTFALVEEVSSGVLTAPISGLMGLGWQQIAASGAIPFWQALAAANDTLSEGVFGIQLTRYNNASTENSDDLSPGGTFTIGGTNTSLYTGDIDYQEIPNGEVGYWLQQITAVHVNGQAISISNGTESYAAIDTGSTLVSGPSDVIADIFSTISGSAAGTGNLEGYYTYPCSASVEVAFTFGSSSVSWTVSTADFEYETTSDGTCISAFVPVDSSGSTPAWILGDTFLKNVYSVFKYSPPSVGFAKLSAEAIALNGAPGAAPSATIGSVAAAVSSTSAGHVSEATATTATSAAVRLGRWGVRMELGAVVAALLAVWLL